MNFIASTALKKHFLLTVIIMTISGTVLAFTSTPTGTVKGRLPSYSGAEINVVDENRNQFIDAGDTIWAYPGAFADPDMDDEDMPTYIWYRDGNVVPGITGNKYTLGRDDIGTKITVAIIPKTDPAITDPYEGVPVFATKGGYINGSANGDGSVLVPTASPYLVRINDANGYSITGINPKVGWTVTAQTLCNDGTFDCFGLRYQWKIETSVGSGIYIDIPGATSKEYLIQKGDQKRKLKVIVS